MVVTTYTINKVLNHDLIQEIATQLAASIPNITSSADGSSDTFIVDHTASQSTNFKKWLANKLILYGDNIAKYTNKNAGTAAFFVYNKVTLTSIGTTYKNLFTDSDGMSFPLETDVFDQIGLYYHWTKNGTGTQSMQIIDINTPANIIATIPSLTTAGHWSGWLDIPATLDNTSNFYKIQVKSTVAADSPVFIGLWVYMK